MCLVLILPQQASYSKSKEPPTVMPEIMACWIGKDIHEMFEHWCYPSEERTILDKHLFIWKNGYTQYANTMYGTVNSYQVSCNRIIEIDENNKIISAKWTGGYVCPMHHMQAEYKQWVYPDCSYYKLKEEAKALKKQQKLQQKEAKKNKKSQ